MMETDIDPLSMLEQTMQVNEYSVTSNGDQEVVMVCDDEPETITPMPLIEIAEEDSVVMLQDGLPVDCERPAIIVPDNYVEQVEPAPTLMLVDPSQLIQQDRLQQMIQQDRLQQMVEPDISMGFGEHFLINPGPSYPCMDESSPAALEAPSPGPISRVMNGRGRGGGKIRGAPRARRTRGGATRVRNITPGNTMNKINDTYMKSNTANTKLVSNAKKLSFASAFEQNYRQKVFSNIEKVLNSRLDCTVCGSHIGCHIDLNVFMVTHPMLKVLMCMQCRENYCSVDWTLGPEYRDTRCRWCSQVPPQRESLKNCSDCPFAFCENCICRNFSKKDKTTIMGKSNWTCFACQLIPLYFMRATCWALSMFITTLSRRKLREHYLQDMSKCCKSISATPPEKQEVQIEDDDVVELTPPPVPQKKPLHISCLPVSSRLNQLFSGIDVIRDTLKTKVKSNIDINNVDGFVSDISLTLSKVGSNLECCLEYLENWRSKIVDDYKREELASVEPDQKLMKGTVNKKNRRVNGTHDYSYLFKKYNIKPCKVVLERLDESATRHETSQPPNFFLSLVPSCSVPTVNEISSDDDNSIICLDD